MPAKKRATPTTVSFVVRGAHRAPVKRIRMLATTRGLSTRAFLFDSLLPTYDDLLADAREGNEYAKTLLARHGIGPVDV